MSPETDPARRDLQAGQRSARSSGMPPSDPGAVWGHVTGFDGSQGTHILPGEIPAGDVPVVFMERLDEIALRAAQTGRVSRTTTLTGGKEVIIVARTVDALREKVKEE